MRIGLAALGDCLEYSEDGVCMSEGAPPGTTAPYENPVTPVTTGSNLCVGMTAAQCSTYLNAVGNVPVGGSSAPVPASGGSIWGSLVNIFGGVASNVGKVYATRNAVPQLNQGESITQLANGTFQITQNASGIATGGSLSLGTSASLTGMMPLLLGAGLLLLLMNKK